MFDTQKCATKIWENFLTVVDFSGETSISEHFPDFELAILTSSSWREIPDGQCLDTQSWCTVSREYGTDRKFWSTILNNSQFNGTYLACGTAESGCILGVSSILRGHTNGDLAASTGAQRGGKWRDDNGGTLGFIWDAENQTSDVATIVKLDKQTTCMCFPQGSAASTCSWLTFLTQPLDLYALSHHNFRKADGGWFVLELLVSGVFGP